MKIITLNLNGIRAASRKNFFPWLKEQNADYICLQELKAQETDLSPEMKSPYGYKGYFNFAIKKGYSGVGIYTKNEPLKVTKHLGIPELDDEGRYIELEFRNLIIISIYLPSGSSGEERQAFKYKVLDKIYKVFEDKLNLGKDIIVCGDFNVAHKSIDLARPKPNYNKSAGHMQEEIDGMNHYESNGLMDAFRFLNPDSVKYSWWSYRAGARGRNIGWRIDYFLVSSPFLNQLNSAEIRYFFLPYS